MLETWGTMTASEVLAPAVALAEDGYALPAWQAALLRAHDALWEEFPESGAALVPDDLRPGVTLYQPVLARTLRQIADGGRAAFYEGEFAEKMVAHSEANGGFFTREDLAAHRSQILEPIRTTYRGVTVTEQPPVSQGCLLLQMLNILEGFDLAALDPEGAEALHLMAEAKNWPSRTAWRIWGMCRTRRSRRCCLKSTPRSSASASGRRPRRATRRADCRPSTAARTPPPCASWMRAATPSPGYRASSTATAAAWSCRARAYCSTTG